MTTFFLKLFLIPGVVFLSEALSPAIDYTNPWQIIGTGLFIGVITYILDALMLESLGSGRAAVVNGIAGTILVYLSGYFMRGSRVTFLGAVLAGVLIGVSEYLVHRLLLNERRRIGNDTVR